MKTKSQFSQNVNAISDRIWSNKHLRHTTTEKYDNKFIVRPNMNSLTKIQKLCWLLGMGRQMNGLDNAT